MIDIFDLAFVGSRYGQAHPLADINADGLVDIFDLALVATNYRRTGPVSLGLDAQLQEVLSQAGITPLEPGPSPDPAEVALGQMLYFDKELSGNRDIACSTCHLPSRRTGDGLSLSIGAGGIGLGPARQFGDGGVFIPRHAPELFNRGAAAWQTLFWDGRLSGTPERGFSSPAGDQLPEHLESILAAQAMFPVTSRDEMRGRPGDEDIFGAPNELALIDDADFTGIWDGLMVRLLNITEYVRLFNAAYPGIPTDELGFEYGAQAIAAFEIESFTLQASPWDRYLGGNELALTDPAKRGALLFYGQAGCSRCHSGNLFTDQQHHNIAAPQIGPGKGAEAPQDFGGLRETGDPADRYAFRTPPLRNVALTGPWLHDGAYTNLKAVVRHHLDPEIGLRSYNSDQLRLELQDTFQDDAETITALLDNLDPLVSTPLTLSDEEMSQLVAFLNALTDPAAKNLSQVVPDSVPSGLSIDR
jgi:cytochrome c peroxidase